MGLAPKSPSRVRSIPSRFRYLFLLATICGGSFLILTISNTTPTLFLGEQPPSARPDTHRSYTRDAEEIFTIDTPGCTIPNLKPFDESIKKFIKVPEVPRCSHANISLLESNETHIWVIKENFEYYNIPPNVSISCCYKSFYRPSAVSDISDPYVDDRASYNSCIEFLEYIEVKNEFVRVTCGYGFRIVYQQFFLFAIKKPMMSFNDDSTEIRQNQSAYNVIVMGIDAISRLNFYRTMPKTLAYLKTKGAIELLGYNKVGDNTFPNLTPMLMGIKDTDLKRTCWPYMTSSFDNCPFIWNWYKEAGYYTALGEDSAKLGTFNFGKYGFISYPTDYYIHTFMHEAEINVGNNKDYNSFICMGNKYFYQVLLDYIASLTKVLKSFRLFGFFWEVTMSHDYLNYPMLIDESYEYFLKKLDDSEYLNETVLILLSDHGIRWGDIRVTKQGRLEERLPFVHILLPQSFSENYDLAYNNLRKNSRRLTTPFDIHATLVDLINLNQIKNENIEIRSNRNYANDKSISLFMPIPSNRTCKSAGIDDHWCTCHKTTKLTTDSPEASQAAEQLVEYLNGLFRDHLQCARLSLVEVLEATEMLAVIPGEQDRGWREIMVVVRTLPGAGIFEGTLRFDGNQWTPAGTVSRLNLYGNQSHCVHHYQLKLYCFCL